jgi:hypothetical protein
MHRSLMFYFHFYFANNSNIINFIQTHSPKSSATKYSTAGGLTSFSSAAPICVACDGRPPIADPRCVAPQVHSQMHSPWVTSGSEAVDI